MPGDTQISDQCCTCPYAWGQSQAQRDHTVFYSVPLISATQKTTQETKPTRAAVGLALRAVTELVFVFQEWTGDSRVTQANTNPQ